MLNWNIYSTYIRLTESKSLGIGLKICVYESSPHDSYLYWILKCIPQNVLALDIVQNIFFYIVSIAHTNEIMHPKISLTIAIASLMSFVETVVHFQPLCTFILIKIILWIWDELDMILPTYAHILWPFICI